MAGLFKQILTDISSAIFNQIWSCILLSFLFLYMYRQNPSLKGAFKQWFLWFRTEREFRRMFVLTFYVSLVLCRTLLNRGISENPLGNVWGYWLVPAILKGNQKEFREAFENLIMLIPFPVLVFWAKGEVLLKRRTFWEVVWKSAVLGFGFSLMIEVLQLILFLGSFQISDLVQNSIGGVIGGLLYCTLIRIKKIGGKTDEKT